MAGRREGCNRDRRATRTKLTARSAWADGFKEGNSAAVRLIRLRARSGRKGPKSALPVNGVESVGAWPRWCFAQALSAPPTGAQGRPPSGCSSDRVGGAGGRTDRDDGLRRGSLASADRPEGPRGRVAASPRWPQSRRRAAIRRCPRSWQLSCGRHRTSRCRTAACPPPP